MKIIFEPRNYKIVKGAILLLAIALMGYVAYAATQLSVSNTGSVVLANKNWQIVTFNPGAAGFPATAAGCPTTGYTDVGPFTIAFGSISQGTTATGAVCVKNVSTAAQSYTSSTAGTPPPVFPAGTTVTYSADGGTGTSGSIAANAISLLTIAVQAGQTTGSITFTTTIA
jgi:hypothetical protein